MLKTRSKKLIETDIVKSLPLGPAQGRESETSIINALVSGDPDRAWTRPPGQKSKHEKMGRRKQFCSVSLTILL